MRKSKKVEGMKVDVSFFNAEEGVIAGNKSGFIVSVNHVAGRTIRLLCADVFQEKPTKKQVKEVVNKAKDRLLVMGADEISASCLDLKLLSE